MQININKKTGSLLGVIAILLALLGLFLFRGADLGMQSHDMGGDMGVQSSNPPLNSSEIMFSQMMIAHHEQAIAISDLALANSNNKEVLVIAAAIKAAQSPEIVLMKSWLDAAGVGYLLDHSMGMNGMLSDGEITVLKNAVGATFDKLFLQGMIAHHEGAIQMASMIANSNNSAIKALHDAIVKTQSAEISQMKAMLKTL